jgi:hypothetical protein
MKIKRVISICLVLTMLFSFTAFAADPDSVAGSAYTPDYDTETPVIIVHGMSQNNTYLVDENGNWVPDETGYVTGWPLEIDVMPLLKRALPNMIASIFTRSDVGLTEAMYEGTYNALSLIEKDNEGKYINNIVTPCYEMPMSEVETVCYAVKVNQEERVEAFPPDEGETTSKDFGLSIATKILSYCLGCKWKKIFADEDALYLLECEDITA